MHNQEQDDIVEQVMEFMEYLDTLSESEAEQVISELDEETIEIIDQVLDEAKRSGSGLGKAIVAGGLVGLGALAGPQIKDAVRGGMQRVQNAASALTGSNPSDDASGGETVRDDGKTLYIPGKKKEKFNPKQVNDDDGKLYIPNEHATDMTFRDFLMEKQIIGFVQHLDTLSESEAQEILSQLDEETLEIIEMVISEGIGETIKKFGKKALPYVAGAALALGGQKMMAKPAHGPVKTQKTHQTSNIHRAVSGQGVSSDPSDE